MENTAHSRHSPLWTVPHLVDIDRQIRWEMQGVERGAERVRKQMEDQKLGDSEVGLALAQRVAPRLIEAIEAAQDIAVAGTTSGKRGRPQGWWYLIGLLSSDKLAVITLKSVFGHKPRDFTFHHSLTGLAAGINRHIHTQLDYDIWKEAEGEKSDFENKFLHLMRRLKNKEARIDEKRFRKFSEKIERTRLERWETSEGIQFGVKLVQLLVESVPEWFSIAIKRLKGGRMETQLVFSQEAIETIADVSERNELSRPMLLPTIIPPADWKVSL